MVDTTNKIVIFMSKNSGKVKKEIPFKAQPCTLLSALPRLKQTTNTAGGSYSNSHASVVFFWVVFPN